MHCIPHPRLHGLKGYKEVIETVAWGLEQLGHQVSYAANQVAPNATNIVFGAQMLPIEVIGQLPADTIMYNFEQIGATDPSEVKPEVLYYAQHFRVWDYCPANMPAWSRFGNSNARLVPVGYAPVLTRIPKPAEQDIDVLLYGVTGQDRVAAFHNVAHAGMSTVFACGLYGAARDDLIARSKIVLNVNYYSPQIFEIVRVSYLLANRKAVVSTLDPGTTVDEDIRPAIKVSSVSNIVNDCLYLLEHEDERIRLENAGLECISKRDIREILRNALEH